jgi:hypothetical protein
LKKMERRHVGCYAKTMGEMPRDLGAYYADSRRRLRGTQMGRLRLSDALA